VSGSSDRERTPEDRARAAAERAARRAARKGGNASGGAPGEPSEGDGSSERTADPEPASRQEEAPPHWSAVFPPGTTPPHDTSAHDPVADVQPTPAAPTPADASPTQPETEAMAAEPDGGALTEEHTAAPDERADEQAVDHEPWADSVPPDEPTLDRRYDPPGDEATRVHPVDREVEVATARPVSAVPARSSRRGRRRRDDGPGDPHARRKGPRWGRRLLALIALLAIGAALYLINGTFQPFHGSGQGAVRVEIPEGANVAAIGDILERRGAVRSGRFFNINVTLTGRRGKLLPGDYTLRRDMSYGDASEALMQGPEAEVVETFDFTIPEGRSRREIAELVEDSAVRGDYLKASARPRLRSRARELGLPSATRTLEGFLFPATYELTGDGTARDLVAKQLDAFEENFAKVDLDRARRRNLTRYDVLTIASMVEREASLDRERPLIAAVIHNRLREGMPLGIDATIRYATDNWTRPIRASELEEDGPYNTRLRAGLPPTPIGNPGSASMRAAANPADVDHLYYVVKPGTCGEHAFSSSGEQFERDRQRYNEARDAQGGQSPTDC
jgi:UPF0755 protein